MSTNGKTNGKAARKPVAKSERVHLLQVRARNVKCIKEVEIDEVGEVHEVRGDAGQGKSGILTSIEGALRGLDASMVRNGESSAEIELLLSNARIERIIPRDGKEKLLVTDSDGHPVKKAQEFLRAICGESAFRPIEWVRMGGGDAKGKTERLRAQRDMLLAALQINLSDDDLLGFIQEKGDEYGEALAEVNLDGIRFDQHGLVVCGELYRATYDYRKTQNAIKEAKEATLANVERPDRKAPDVDLADLEEVEKAVTDAYYRAEAKADNQGSLRAQYDALKARIEGEGELPDRDKLGATRKEYEKQRDNATAEIERLETLLKTQQARLSEATSKLRKCEELEDRIATHEARKTDLAKLEEELKNAGTGINLDVMRKGLEDAKADTLARRLQDKLDEAAADYEVAAKRAEIFTALVEMFRDELPKLLIESADLPVEGLSIDEDTILIHSVPLHQLGTSEQIKVGVLISSALNPRCGFVLVDGAESMGKSDLLALREAALEHDLQLIMTYVDADAQPAEGRTVMREGVAV